jgi:hypothetical protein
MASKPLTFRERDLRAAIHAVEKSGKQIHGIEVARDGTIRILTTPPFKAAESSSGLRGWDDV